MGAEFKRNVVAKDAERLAKDFYAEGAQYYYYPHQRPAVGRPAIQGVFEAMIGRRSPSPGVANGQDRSVWDLAYGIGLYKMTATLDSGAEIPG